MPHLIDLTIPIADHFRWPVERQLKRDFASGDQFQVTWLGWAITEKTVELYALPLKILEADGAPARVIAMQD